MRLIPGRTKVKIELFRGITLGDVIVGAVTLGLITLIILSSFPARLYIGAAVFGLGTLLVLRIDTQPNYRLLLNLLKYIAYPKRYTREHTDEQLFAKYAKLRPTAEDSAEYEEEPEEYLVDSLIDNIKQLKKEKKQKHKQTAVKDTVSSELSDEKTDTKKGKKPENTAAKKQKKPSSPEKSEYIEDIIAFSGFGDGFIEYHGKYYGTVIEIDPVEFRFFSQYRRDASIENCLGKIIRSLKLNYAANIVKIDRPMIYDKYLDKEYDRLDELKASYEKGFLTEDELQSRIEIQYDRINAMRDICFESKVIQPFYYLVLFNSDKKQLNVDTDSAMTEMRQGELTVRRLSTDKELAVFLKYTYTLDFDERDIDDLDPDDYAEWAMPESLSFNYRKVDINKIVTHQMRVVGYPSEVGDAWLAGVMSVPSTKVVVKITPMERTKSIRTIDRSLGELRGQLMTTGVDSKRLELESHIETLGMLLVTLQQDNESLLAVNIYISMYDVIKTSELGNDDAARNSSFPAIADMKKTVRRVWQETGMRLNQMDFGQVETFIGSQVSGYDPFFKDGRPMPSNTIAGMYPWIFAHVSDEGGVRLGTQDGVPVFIDFFRRDSERVNSNMVIIGKSGSGKSYGTKSLLTNMASEDAKIFILDPENEYTELAHTLHGKIINVGNASAGRLNPFHIITNLEDDEDIESTGDSYSAHLQFLEEFFKQILPDVDKDALEYLNSMVERMYANFGITLETDLSTLTPRDYPIFDDLYDLVLEDFQRTNNEYIRKILQELMNYVSKFATGGRNANIWNGPSSITTEENFTVFNFQSLLANRNTTVANAQMLLVLKYLDNEIIKNRDYNRKYGLNRKIIVAIDEAHVFIDTKFPIALDFMFQLAKRIRKYNGMQIVITQNIKDFVGSEDIARKSTAIINACQYSFIFGLAPNDMDDLCKLYEKAGGINEVEQDQIVTAPRGRAFTVMSPTARSTFTIEVPQTMVDMFESPDYQTHYFGGEEGRQVWENFIADSRAEHEANIGNRISGYVYVDPEEREQHYSEESVVTFSEITAEEADRLTEERAVFGEDRVYAEPPQFKDTGMHPEDDDGGITFEEIESEPEPFAEEQPAEESVLYEDEPIAEEPVRYDEEQADEEPYYESEPQPVQPAPVRQEQNQTVQPTPQDRQYAPMFDMGELIRTIREEVRREFEIQRSAHMAELSALGLVKGVSLEKPAAPTYPEQDYEPEEDIEPDLGNYEDEESEPDYSNYEDEEPEPEYDEDEEPEPEYDEDEEPEPEYDEDEEPESEYDEDEDEDEDERYFDDDDDDDEEADDDDDELYYDDDEDDDDDDDDDEDDDDDFVPKFDIMALLDEQLESYSEMTLAERMEEIDVTTMEITLDDLAKYIKDSRKRR